MFLGAVHLSIFATIVLPRKSVKKYWKYFIDFFTIVSPLKFMRPIPGPLSQVMSNFPHSALLHSPSFLTGEPATWGLCPSFRGYFPLRELSEPKSLSLASCPFRFPHGVLIDCCPSESPFMDGNADHNENQRKLDRCLKSICITIEMSILCIVVGIWASYTIFTLYCYRRVRSFGINPEQE